MSKWRQFALGGLGGLIPLLVTLYTADVAAIRDLIDQHQLTEGLCVGYGIKVVCLFLLGGGVVAFDAQANTPFAMLKLGALAPALVTTWMGAAAVAKPVEVEAHAFGFVSSAFASAPWEGEARVEQAGFLSDVGKGLLPGLGQTKAAPPAGGPAFRLRNPSARTCINVSPAQSNAPGGLAQLQASVPPGFQLEPGACE